MRMRQSRPGTLSSTVSSRMSSLFSLLSMASMIVPASKSSGGQISRSSLSRSRSICT